MCHFWLAPTITPLVRTCHFSLHGPDLRLQNGIVRWTLSSEHASPTALYLEKMLSCKYWETERVNVRCWICTYLKHSGNLAILGLQTLGQQLARDELGQLPSGGTDASQLPWLPAVSQCHPCHVPPKEIYSFVSGWAPVGIWVYSLYPDLWTTKPSLLVSACWVRKVPVWDMKIPLFEKVERRGKTTCKLIVP